MKTPDFKATYSPEDNKLRLYAFERLDAETYEKAKEHGFRYAPKQELFVKPRWTPQAEDFLLSLAGEITAEELTMIDRAQAKIERLDGIAANAEQRANGYADTAANIAERFAAGQPILIGHHSQRKAERDAERIQSAQERATKEFNKIDYWNYRAQGVAHHANRKNCDRTRANRIKKLLADLRDMQRAVTKSEKALSIWQRIDQTEDAETRTKYVNSYKGHYEYGCGVKLSYAFERGEITEQALIDRMTAYHGSTTNYNHRQRWIMHILNRLGYEQNEAGETPRFEGCLNAGKIQTFCRTHGADKPKARKEDDFWIVESDATLPLHIGKGSSTLSLEADEWLDLMQSVGYVVPADKVVSKKPPILNFKADKVRFKRHWKGAEDYEQISMTKAEYKAQYGTKIMLSECKTFRIRTCFMSKPGSSFAGGYKAVFLTDSKEHDAPEVVENAAE